MEVLGVILRILKKELSPNQYYDIFCHSIEVLSDLPNLNHGGINLRKREFIALNRSTYQYRFYYQNS